jgi:hypothetical protein
MPAIFDVEGGLERTEGDFAAAMFGVRDRRRSSEVEILAIPDVGFDDPPAADELAVRGRAHVAPAKSFGSRARL